MANQININPCSCKESKGMLVDYAAGALFPGDARRMEAHLETCRRCREEYLLMQRIHEESLRLDQGCNTVMASIDWEETAHTITSNIPFKGTAPRKSRKSWFDFNLNAISFNWKIAVPVMTGVFLLGIWLGYFLFHNRPAAAPGPVLSKVDIPSKSPLARLENTLARKEVASYFDQTQLVLTDLMKQCNTDGSFSLQDQVDMRRIRELLSKSRYFKDSLNNPQLLSSKELLKKIEWLLYEILMTNIEQDNSCEKLQQVQDYIKQERLLLKIRLVGKELSLSEV